MTERAESDIHKTHIWDGSPEHEGESLLTTGVELIDTRLGVMVENQFFRDGWEVNVSSFTVRNS